MLVTSLFSILMFGAALSEAVVVPINSAMAPQSTFHGTRQLTPSSSTIKPQRVQPFPSVSESSRSHRLAPVRAFDPLAGGDFDSDSDFEEPIPDAKNLISPSNRFQRSNPSSSPREQNKPAGDISPKVQYFLQKVFSNGNEIFKCLTEPPKSAIPQKIHTDQCFNPDKLKDLVFVGWHGTISSHIDSIHNGIEVDEDVTKRSSEGKMKYDKFGKGFYVTDAISESRQFAEQSRLECLTKLEANNPEATEDDKKVCEQAVCAVFAGDEFWKDIPKVVISKYSPKFWTLDGPSNILSMYLYEHYQIKRNPHVPVVFSHLYRTGKQMEAKFDSEHVKSLVAVCAVDDIAASDATDFNFESFKKRESETKGSKKDTEEKGLFFEEDMELQREGQTNLGRFFGDTYASLLKFKYQDFIEVAQEQPQAYEGWDAWIFVNKKWI
ncbi:hypothetical protein BKA69DRAFT_1056701 [Paraphysoderma sedebokerense]|nr:hypothetical protein BKA69DRAFT_1056701 [Paraphysoderma sedebokerense]